MPKHHRINKPLPAYPRPKPKTFSWKLPLLALGAICFGAVIFWFVTTTPMHPSGTAPVAEQPQNATTTLPGKGNATQNSTSGAPHERSMLGNATQSEKVTQADAIDADMEVALFKEQHSTVNATDDAEPLLVTEAGPASLLATTGTTTALLAANQPPQPRAPHQQAPSTALTQMPLASIAVELAKDPSIARQPLVFGEHIPGVTKTLSHVWKPQQQQAQPAAQSTAPALPGANATIALTLDACGGRPGTSYDAAIITLLRKHNIPATIFVTSMWIKNNQETFKELAADPLFEIAAHGSSHRPATINGRSIYEIRGTASLTELLQEVEANAREITRLTGKRPRWFRSGTAYYDDVAINVIRKLQLGIAGYSITADEGARLPAGRVAQKILLAKDGDIILAHMNRPGSGTSKGLADALPQLIAKGYKFVHLSADGHQ